MVEGFKGSNWTHLRRERNGNKFFPYYYSFLIMIQQALSSHRIKEMQASKQLPL